MRATDWAMNEFMGRHFDGEVPLRLFTPQDGIAREARIVERAYGVGPCVLTEVMGWLQDQLASVE